MNHGLFFRKKYSLQLYCFQVKKKVNNLTIYSFKKNVSLKHFYLKISASEKFTFKIGSSRVVENIFPEK